jgi:hypothetical protein
MFNCNGAMWVLLSSTVWFSVIGRLCATAGLLPEVVEEPERHDQGYGEGAHQHWTVGTNVCFFRF